MNQRGSSNAWKFLAAFAIVSVFAATLSITYRHNKLAPAQTAVAGWIATSTPAPGVTPEPTVDCCHVGHDWLPTKLRAMDSSGGCDGPRPLARCKNCGLWRTEK